MSYWEINKFFWCDQQWEKYQQHTLGTFCSTLESLKHIIFHLSKKKANLCLMLWKRFQDYTGLFIKDRGCLSTSGLLCQSGWKSVRGAKLAWITSVSPHSANCHFRLDSHYTVTCFSLLPTSTSTSVSLWSFPLFSRLDPKAQWSKMEHSNYSLAELKIANNCECVLECEEGVWMVLSLRQPLPWQPGLCRWVSPLRLQTFLSINIKGNCPQQYC